MLLGHYVEADIREPYYRTSYYKIVSYIYDKKVTLLHIYENMASSAVYNIENGQPNQSTMERPHSGGTAYVITVSPVLDKYA